MDATNIYTLLVALNSILLGVVGFFLARFMKHADKKDEALIELAAEVKVLVVNMNNDKEALKRHEIMDEKEHERIRTDIEFLGARDHELANLINGCWGVLQLDGRLPEMPNISNRKR